jgi:hypothetical protein
MSIALSNISVSVIPIYDSSYTSLSLSYVGTLFLIAHIIFKIGLEALQSNQTQYSLFLVIHLRIILAIGLIPIRDSLDFI